MMRKEITKDTRKNTEDIMIDTIEKLKEEYYLIVLDKINNSSTKSKSNEREETKYDSLTKSNLSTSSEDDQKYEIQAFNESKSTEILSKIIENASKIQCTDKLKKMFLSSGITEISKLNNYIKRINELIKDYKEIGDIVNKNTIGKMLSKYNILKELIISEYNIPNELNEEHYYFKLMNTLNKIGNKINKLNKRFEIEEILFQLNY